jgi:hypothetical protein
MIPVFSPHLSSLTQNPFISFIRICSLYAGNVLEKLGQTSRRLSTVTAPTFINHHRRFGNVDRTVLEQADDQLKTCDVAFIGCLKSDECIKCFSSLQTEGIDWASVTPETPCKDVVNFLFDGGREYRWSTVVLCIYVKKISLT